MQRNDLLPEENISQPESESKHLNMGLELSQIMNEVSDSIILHDQGKFIYFNQSAHRICGYNKEEMEKLTLFDIVSPEYVDLLKPRMVEVNRKGKLLVEAEIKHKNGEIIPVEVNSRIMEMDGKRLILSVIRDIRERVLIQNGKEKVQNLSQIINQIPDFLFILDLKGNMQFINPYFKENLGWDEEILGENLKSLIVESEISTNKWEKLLTQGYLDQEECILKHREGHLLPVIINAVKIKEELDQKAKIILLAQNISQQKKVEEELNKSKTLLKDLINNMKDGFGVLNEKGEHVMVNTALSHMTQYSMEELLGVGPPHPYWGEEEQALIQEKLDKLMLGELENIELIFQRKDRSKFPVLLSPSIIITPEKNKYYYATIKDISYLKSMENDLKSSLQEKEVLINEIYHRVKNNLQVLSSLLSLQIQYVQDEQDLEMFRDTQSRVKSMFLIHERLYHSDLVKKLNIKDYILSLSKDVLETFGVKPGKIELDLDVENVMLDVDLALHLGLLLNELLTNSIKHAFPGEDKGKIEVKLKHQPPYILMEVADDGVGIREDINWKNTETLGMQLVNSLTTQLEGTLHLDETQGTCFKLRFPFSI